MTSRERILTTLRGGLPDRIGRHDEPWPETITRWRTEGLGAEEDVRVKFDFDFGGLDWPDYSLRFPVEIIEDCDEYRIQWDANGVLRKDFKRELGHTPHWMDHKLATRADWEKHKERLAWSDDRITATTRQAYDNARARDLFTYFTLPEAYEMTWPIWGQVGTFTLMMDDPELIADCFAAYTDLILTAARRMLELGMEYDGAWFYGDLGYRNSTLFAPALYDELLFPQHKRMCDFFNDLGKPVILHSCGRILDLIPRFIKAGFAAIQPLEAKAGQDIRELKKIYGKGITFFGNMDVRKLSGSREDIKEEVLSKLAVVRDGGYIYHSDHSVPPTVSWGNYCYLMELLDEHGRY